MASTDLDWPDEKVSALYMNSFEETLTELRIVVGQQHERYEQILKELARVSATSDGQHDSLKQMISSSIAELRRNQNEHEKAIAAMEKKVNGVHWFISGVAATGAAVGAAVSWVWQFVKGG